MKLIRTRYYEPIVESSGNARKLKSTTSQLRWVHYENPTSSVQVKQAPSFEPEIDPSLLPPSPPSTVPTTSEEADVFFSDPPPSYSAPQAVQDSLKPASLSRKAHRNRNSKPYRRNSDSISSGSTSSTASSAALLTIDNAFHTLQLNINNVWSECRTVVNQLEKERDELAERLERLAVRLESRPQWEISGNETATRFSEIGPGRTRLMRRACRLDKLLSSRSHVRMRNSTESDELGFVPHGVGDDSYDVECSGLQLNRREELGIHYIDLLYSAQDGRLYCRACCVNAQNYDKHDPAAIKNFSNVVPWEELRQHCVTEHPDECRDIERLSLPQVVELRQRLTNSTD